MNHRRIIRRSLLATLTTLSLLPITVANAADADGTLLWGIRSSFNNYTHGPTKLTDVERENNAFKFKMDSYSTLRLSSGAPLCTRSTARMKPSR